MHQNRNQNRNRHQNRNRFSRPRRHSGGGRQTIKTFDPTNFVKKAVMEPEEVYEAKHKFSDFAINKNLLRNIQTRGYDNPTPIQDQAIEPLLQGRDVVGIANTGTGKTAAFLIPLINKVLGDRDQRVLIIAPTRELALQIENELKIFARDMHLYSVLCIGGVSMMQQIHSLRRNPHFVIGTPGRLRDLERQKKLNFANYRSIVLDEVDRMLDMGFIEEVKYITSKLARPRQSIFFSATLPTKAQTLMSQFLTDPVLVSVKSRESAANVDQDVVRLNGREKIEVLAELLQKPEFEKVLVFGRTKWGTEKIARALEKHRIVAATIHGNKKQSQRQRAIEHFKRGRVKVLIATDVASRGLDIDDVTHVINYDLPESHEVYIHRIGRTGRANKKGIALTFVD